MVINLDLYEHKSLYKQYNTHTHIYIIECNIYTSYCISLDIYMVISLYLYIHNYYIIRQYNIYYRVQ